MIKRNKLVVLALALVAVLSIVVYVTLLRDRGSEQGLSEKPGSEQQINAGHSEPTPSFNKSFYSTTEPSSLWTVVNKKHSLDPKSYAPSDLSAPAVRLRLGSGEEQMKFRKIGQTDLIAMFNAAFKDGVNLVFGSGYRSYALQKQFYDGYVAKDGQAQADTYSARPGHSEHQTGLAVDLTSPGGKCHLEICWQETPEGKWAALNAYKYGFILRYPNGKEEVTGYQYEPWHFRYVGKELSNEMHNQKIETLEEFFGILGGTSY